MILHSIFKFRKIHIQYYRMLRDTLKNNETKSKINTIH